MVGIGSDAACALAVFRSSEIGTLTKTLPRSKGPATAGVSTARLSGAPL